jgi:putative ABC transport system permease protein
MYEVLTVLRRAVRRLMLSPAYLVPMVVTLAIGIGAAVAVFALVDAVMLRPLGYPEPDRLVTLRHRAPGLGIADGGQSAGTYLLYRAQNRAFTDVGVYWEREYTITDGAVPERVPAAIVTPSVLNVLNVPPALGRWFALDEDQSTVVLSYGLWQRRYGGDPNVVGRTIEINGTPDRIAGVTPRGFAFPRPETQLWYANRMRKTSRAGISVHDLFMTGVARLRPGVSAEAATRDLERIAPAIGTTYGDASPELLRRAQLRPIAVPLREAVVRDARPMLLVLTAAATLVLLIVYANATTLALLRAERQQPQVATEYALGAPGSHVWWRCASEAAIVALVGGAGGLVLASAAVASKFGFTARQVPRLEGVTLAGGPLALLGALVVLTGAVLAGVALARARRVRSADAPWRALSRLTATRERLRMQRMLVTAQLALALALLVASAVLARSFDRLRHVDIGFQPKGMLLFDVAIPPGSYTTYHAQASFFGQVLSGLRAMSGVKVAEAVQNGIPFAPIDGMLMDAVGALPGDGPPSSDSTSAATSLATPGYFAAMGIPLVEGRTFQDGDVRNPSHPVVVSASLARALFPAGSALNRRIKFTAPKRAELPPSTIVGVVGDVPGTTIADGPSRRLYLPMLQDLAATPDVDPMLPYWPMELTLVVRTDLPLATMAASLRRVVNAHDPKVPVWRERTAESVVASATAGVRLMTTLFGVATLVALVLGIVGVYGVLAYAVTQRTAELGIRLALGAGPAELTRMVVRDGARLAVIGGAVGLAAAALLTRLLRAVLYEVGPGDPLAFALMPLLLVGLSLLAAYIPARRAARTDPVTALKLE